VKGQTGGEAMSAMLTIGVLTLALLLLSVAGRAEARAR
jgi:hypothetical protein